MKQITLILVVIGMLLSCSADDTPHLNTELLGHWELIEILSDPGDGSGKFERVDSKKTLEFKRNGVVKANGVVCHLSTEANATVLGTFSQINFTINTPNCSALTFEKNDNELVITIPCEEPCKVKYRKIK